MLIKEHDILKKPYLAPRISFEEIEEDELDMLMAGSDTTGGGSGQGSGDGTQNPGDEGEFESDNSLDIDFVINDI